LKNNQVVGKNCSANCLVIYNINTINLQDSKLENIIHSGMLNSINQLSINPSIKVFDDENSYSEITNKNDEIRYKIVGLILEKSFTIITH
jgi:hypothetical protein